MASACHLYRAVTCAHGSRSRPAPPRRQAISKGWVACENILLGPCSESAHPGFQLPRFSVNAAGFLLIPSPDGYPVRNLSEASPHRASPLWVSPTIYIEGGAFCQGFLTKLPQFQILSNFVVYTIPVIGYTRNILMKMAATVDQYLNFLLTFTESVL